VQSQWQADTGYYAIRKSAYNEPPSKEWAGKYPQFLTAVEQIRAAPVNRMTQGAVIGVFPEARARVQKAVESVLLGRRTASRRSTQPPRRLRRVSTSTTSRQGVRLPG
jgi:sn-glycerol 3-phosphate transport system substrate-binding protein